MPAVTLASSVAWTSAAMISTVKLGCSLPSFRVIKAMSNDCHGIWNYWLVECLFNSLFRLTAKKHQSSTLLSLCEGNPPVTTGFPAQRGINAEIIFILWRHKCEGHQPAYFSVDEWCKIQIYSCLLKKNCVCSDLIWRWVTRISVPVVANRVTGSGFPCYIGIGLYKDTVLC